MAQGDNLGAKFSLDITNLKAGLADANKLIRQSESEFIEAAAGLNDWSKSSDGLSKRVSTLNDQIEIQKAKMQSLISVRNETIAKMKEEGAADEDIAAVADRVNVQLQKEEKQLETLQGRAEKASKELESFDKAETDAGKGADNLSSETDKAAKSAKKAGDGFTVFKGVLSDLASSAIKGAANAVKNGVANIGKGLKSVVSESITAGDEIAKSAQKAGFTSKTAFQEWSYVLERTGTDISALNKGFIAISTASDKSKKAITGLGVSFKDTNGKARANEDIFADVVSKLSSMTDETKKSQIAQQIFGKSFGELRPLLNGGAESADALRKRAHELGVVMSDEMLTNAENAKDSLTDLNASITGMKNNIVSTFLPSISGVVDGLTSIFSGSDVDGGLAKISTGVSDVAKQLLTNVPTFAKAATSIISALIKAFTDALPEIMSTLATLISSSLPVMIGGLTELVKNLVSWLADGSNIKSIIDGVVQLCLQVANGLTAIIPVLIPAVNNAVLEIVKAFTEPQTVKSLVEAGTQLLKSVLDGILAAIPVIIEQLPVIIQNICQAITESLPLLIDAGVQMFTAILNGIVSTLPALLAELPKIIDAVCNALIESLPLILDSAIQMFMALVDALPIIIESLVAALPNVINSIINFILQALPAILEAAIKLFMALIEALPTIISTLVKELPKIITTIISTLLSRLPDLIKGAIELFMGIIKAIPQIIIELGKQMPTIIKSIIEGLMAGLSQIGEVGVALMKGLLEGLKNGLKAIGEGIKKIGDGIVGTFKKIFKIASPSKLFRDEIGKNLALGIGVGFEDEMPNVARNMQSSLNAAIPAVNSAFGGGSDSAGQSGGGSGVVVYQTNNYSQQHSRFEIYQSKQATAAAVRAALAGG